MRSAVRRLLAVAAVLLARPAAADEGFRFDPPKPGYDFALNPDTGGLAVVVPDEHQVVLYPRFVATHGKGEPVVARVGKVPLAVAFKRFGDAAYFAVLCHDARELTLLDAATLKAVKTFPLEVAWPSAVFASADPKDPAVYYAGQQRERGGVVGRVDLGAMTDDGVLTVRGEVGLPAVSADGARLYVWQGAAGVGGDGQAVGVYEFAPDRTTRLIRKTTVGPGAMSPVRVDPFDGFVAFGRRVLAPRLDAEVATLPFPAELVSAARPVIFGFQNTRLAAASVNTHKVVGGADLPFKPHDLEPAARLKIDRPVGRPPALDPRYRPRVLEDAANGAVLVCTAAGVVVVPLADLKLPDEPFLGVRVGGPRDLQVGRKGELDVSPVRPGTKVELVSGPDGLALAGGKLTWTPGDAAVGTHPVRLKASAKGAERTTALTVRVTRPSIPLPFPNPRYSSHAPVVLSADGTAVIAVGVDDKAERPGGLPPRPSVVAVVDLEKGAVAAQRNLLVGVTAVAADAAYVYVGLAESDALYVLHRKDLTEAKRVPTPARVSDVTPVGDRFVVVTCASDGGRTGDARLVLKVPEWTPTRLGDVVSRDPPPRQAPREGLQPPLRVPEGWWADGVLYDEALGKVRAVVSPPGFWRYAAGAPRDVWTGPGFGIPPADVSRYHDRNTPLWFARWGLGVSPQGRLTNGLRDVAAVEGHHPNYRQVVFPADPPVVASLRSAREGDDSRPPRRRVGVAYQDLSTAKTVLRVPLSDDDEERAPVDSLGTYAALFARPGGGLVAVAENRIFVLPAPKLDPAVTPKPVRFAPEYPVALVGAKPARVPLPKLLGATDPVELGLRREVKGITVDKAAGELVVDPAALTAALTDGIGTYVGNLRPRPGVKPVVPPAPDAEVLERYLAEAGPRVERLTGKKPAGVPVWVPVAVVAQDKELRAAEADVGFFLDVPVAAVRAKADAVFAGQAAKGPEPKATPEPKPAVTPAQVADLLREQGKMQLRVETLEKKIDELTAKIDQLTKALEKRKVKD